MYNLFTEFKSDPKPEKGADGKEIKKNTAQIMNVDTEKNILLNCMTLVKGGQKFGGRKRPPPVKREEKKVQTV